MTARRASAGRSRTTGAQTKPAKAALATGLGARAPTAAKRQVHGGRQARGDATRARIVQAARKLTVHGGPAGLTLRAVAAEVGISLSNVQFHFADQDALLRAVLEAELRNGEAFVMRAVAARPEDPVRAAIDALLALQHQRGAARLFFSMWAVATTAPRLRAELHAFYAAWIERLSAVAAPHAQSQAWLFVALLEGASLFRCGIAGRTNAAQDDMLRALLYTLIGYAAPDASPSPGAVSGFLGSAAASGKSDGSP